MSGSTLLRRLGRFELQALLGKGAQGEVWLATDRRLQRPVAIKTLDVSAWSAPSRADDTRRLLDEAMIVSRISHPNVVTLYDAGELDGAPYLVFEYVKGEPLDAYLRKHGQLPIRRAAEIMQGVASGIACAHRQAVVHRDIKPANVILAEDGTPRVMDFGIAQDARTRSHRPDDFAGTPAYIAPEAIGGAPFTPRSDVFALGVMFYELLTGSKPFRGRTAEATMDRIVSSPVAPPSSRNARLDDRYDDVVLKALAKDPGQRYGEAEAFVCAMRGLLQPAADTTDPGSGGTLAFLLRRMRNKGDFPALSETVRAINKTTSSDRERSNGLAAAILRDVALTNKLLRLVNSAYYGQFRGSVSTVSRAIAILGFDTVRSAALSLLLLDHLQDKARAGALRDESFAAYYAGLLARQIGPRHGDAREEAFICAMFQRFGRLLAQFYLPEEAEHAALLIESGTPAAAAWREALGVTCEELGHEVAKSWGFPDTILRGMQPVPDGALTPALAAQERVRTVASAANELCNALRSADADAALAQVAGKYAGALGVKSEALRAATESAAVALAGEARNMGVEPGRSPFVDRMRGTATAAARRAAAPAPAAAEEPALADATLTEATITDATLLPAAEARAAALVRGVNDLSQMPAGRFRPADVLRVAVESMYRCGAFSRVLLFLREGTAARFVLRAGLGEGAEELVRARVALKAERSEGVLYAALAQNADLLLPDLDADKVRRHVPSAVRQAIGSRGLLLLPLAPAQRCVALLYADHVAAGALDFSREELLLLKALRNQAAACLAKA